MCYHGTMKKITEAEYRDATNNYLGWCTGCEEFTRDNTEPDARGYDCPKCREYTVMGAEDAVLTGEITVES